MGAVTRVLAVVGMIGVGKQEAFQLLWNASGLFYSLTYRVLFAIPLWGLRTEALGPHCADQRDRCRVVCWIPHASTDDGTRSRARCLGECEISAVFFQKSACDREFVTPRRGPEHVMPVRPSLFPLTHFGGERAPVELGPRVE